MVNQKFHHVARRVQHSASFGRLVRTQTQTHRVLECHCVLSAGWTTEQLHGWQNRSWHQAPSRDRRMRFQLERRQYATTSGTAKVALRVQSHTQTLWSSTLARCVVQVHEEQAEPRAECVCGITWKVGALSGSDGQAPAERLPRRLCILCLLPVQKHRVHVVEQRYMQLPEDLRVKVDGVFRATSGTLRDGKYSAWLPCDTLTKSRETPCGRGVL